MAHQLTVRDTEGHDLLTRPMEPGERYVYYRAYSEGELISFDGKRYRLHSVAWRHPQQDCMLLVSFDSWEPSADDE